MKQMEDDAAHQHRQFEELNRIGIALSSEHDIDKLQELILTTCRQLTRDDHERGGGSLRACHDIRAPHD